MTLAVCVFITWCVMILFALIPKKLTELEMIFLFFICTIFSISIFQVFHLNLHWIEVNWHFEKSFADLVIRLFCIPIMLVIAANIMLYTSTFLKWSLLIAIVLTCVMFQKTEVWLGIITTPHWNMGYTALAICVNIAFARLMTWFILFINPKEGKIS